MKEYTKPQFSMEFFGDEIVLSASGENDVNLEWKDEWNRSDA